LPRLKLAFQTLVEKLVETRKLFLLVDGLDEYDGDHFEIADFFQNIAKSRNVKVCLSSRPWLVFEEAFKNVPSLRVQDLTSSDITLYVGDKLKNDRRMEHLAKRHPEGAKELIDEIVTKAQGVFLWVTLVVASLLQGLGNRDGIVDLQKRLRLIPPTLKDLYKHMLTRLDPPFYLEQASRIFQLMRAKEKLDQEFPFAAAWDFALLGLSLADNNAIDLEKPETTPQWTQQDILAECDEMEYRLTSRCAGLFEVTGDHKWQKSASSEEASYRGITYLHRTVRDFLKDKDVWEMIVALTTESGFQPSSRLLKAFILQFQLSPSKCRKRYARKNIPYRDSGTAIDSHDPSALCRNRDAKFSRRSTGYV